jgi:hypothetical protein
MILVMCEICEKDEEYHSCKTCAKRICIACFNKIHFGIGAPRESKSMIYNKCVFCNAVFAADAKRQVCTKCEIILTWKSSMNYLAAVNRISVLVEKGDLDQKLRNENYCKANFGMHAAQVIMDAVDNSKL